MLDTRQMRLHSAQQLSTLLPLWSAKWHIGQPENWTNQTAHSQCCIDWDGVGLTEKPRHQWCQALVELLIPVLHQAREQARYQIACDRDHALRAMIMPSTVCLVVIAAPTPYAALRICLQSLTLSGQQYWTRDRQGGNRVQKLCP